MTRLSGTVSLASKYWILYAASDVFWSECAKMKLWLILYLQTVFPM